MKKKICAILMAMVLSVCCLSAPVSALVKQPDEINWSYTRSVYNNISISGKTITCTSTVQGYPGETTKILITQLLQMYQDGKWVNIGIWTDVDNYYTFTATRSLSNRAPGRYRLCTKSEVYAGTKCEKVTKYTVAKTLK